MPDRQVAVHSHDCVLLAVVQLLLSEEKDKERPENVEDDEDGHLIYNKNDVIRKRCETFPLLNKYHSSLRAYDWISNTPYTYAQKNL